MMNALRWALCLPFALTALAVGCGSNDDDTAAGTAGTAGSRPEATGASCETAADCYAGVIDKSTLLGQVQCLDRVEDGYCTHLCESDDDCCAASGECKTSIRQVCSPFESTNLRMCFLSCESADLVAADAGAGDVDANEYCQREASPDFMCRSSGGGAQNRKICVPGDCGVGEACTTDAECAAGLACITAFQGGYCSIRDCADNADCPNDAVCVARGGVNYCLKRCGADSECSFCRPLAQRLGCTADVADVEGATASVCAPL